MTISDRAQASARELTDTFATSPTFVTCRNSADGVSIDLAVCNDQDGDGPAFAGTVTLADHDLGYHDIRLQMVAVYPRMAKDFSRALGTCALSTVERGWPLRWGAVHPDVLTIYHLSKTLPHLYFMPPFSWSSGPKPLTIGEHRIEWLQAIPISEAERAFAEAHGAQALEEKLVKANIDITDLKRASAIK